MFHPSTFDKAAHPFHVPGVEMIERCTYPWVSRPTHFRSFQELISMVDWIRITLQRGRKALEGTEIYKTVFLSLFLYDWDADFFRSLVERWNYISNTVILEDRELTITPVDFSCLSGLPIFGIPYDKYMPCVQDLLPLANGSSKRISTALKQVFHIYS